MATDLDTDAASAPALFLYCGMEGVPETWARPTAATRAGRLRTTATWAYSGFSIMLFR